MQKEKIRNVRKFVGSYLQSKSGQQALSRRPYTANKVNVWATNQMATAFAESVGV